MKPVSTLWDKIYKAPLFLFGIPFFVIGVVFLMMDGGWGFLLNGVLWIIMGMGIKIKSTYDKRRLESLKREG